MVENTIKCPSCDADLTALLAPILDAVRSGAKLSAEDRAALIADLKAANASAPVTEPEPKKRGLLW